MHANATVYSPTIAAAPGNSAIELDLFHQNPTIARPVQPQQPTYVVTAPQVVNYQPQRVENNAGRRQYPVNRWGDSICDWPRNLFPSCYCVCCVCCGVYLAAQIGQKTGYTQFNTVIATFVGFCILAFFLQIFLGGFIIVWIPMAFVGIYSIGLRMHIVRRENITDCGANPLFGECCVGFWCWYCSLAQMARHVYGYEKVLDGDGDPFRPDSYASGGMQV